jgi:hypothetical protein
MALTAASNPRSFILRIQNGHSEWHSRRECTIDVRVTEALRIRVLVDKVKQHFGIANHPDLRWLDGIPRNGTLASAGLTHASHGRIIRLVDEDFACFHNMSADQLRDALSRLPYNVQDQIAHATFATEDGFDEYRNQYYRPNRHAAPSPEPGSRVEDLRNSLDGLPVELYAMIKELTFAYDGGFREISEHYKPPVQLQIDRRTRRRFSEIYYGAQQPWIRPANVEERQSKADEFLFLDWLASLSDESRTILHNVHFEDQSRLPRGLIGEESPDWAFGNKGRASLWVEHRSIHPSGDWHGDDDEFWLIWQVRFT